MARKNNNDNNNNANDEKIVQLPVITAKAKNGDTSTVDANSVATVEVAALTLAAAYWPLLCLNLLADKADMAIVRAAKKRGGLVRLFGGKLCDPDIKALKTILETDAPTRQAAWLAYVTKAKVVRTISLSGLAKAVKNHGKDDDDDDKPLTLKQKLAAWCKANDGGRELPASLFDLFIEADVIASDEAAAR